MATVCVTYNTLSLTPVELLREYDGPFIVKKPYLRLFIINSIRLGISLAYLQSRCQCGLANVLGLICLL
jgi:hypothetical protein